MRKSKKKIEKIKSDSQISEDEIRKYNELTTSIAQKQGEIKIIESDIKILNEIVPENLFNSYFDIVIPVGLFGNAKMRTFVLLVITFLSSAAVSLKLFSAFKSIVTGLAFAKIAHGLYDT